MCTIVTSSKFRRVCGKQFFFHEGIDCIVFTEHVLQSVFLLFFFFEIVGCLVLNSYKDYLFIKRDHFYFVVVLGFMVSTIFGLFTLFCELPEDPNLKCNLGSD